MPIHHQVDSKAQVIVSTWEGLAADIDVTEALKSYQKTFQNHSDYCRYNEVLDASKVEGISLTSEGVKVLGSIASSTDQIGSSRKLAIIVNSTFAYGIARMYLAYRDFGRSTHKEIRLFRKEKDAFHWAQKSCISNQSVDFEE